MNVDIEAFASDLRAQYFSAPDLGSLNTFRSLPQREQDRWISVARRAVRALGGEG